MTRTLMGMSLAAIATLIQITSATTTLWLALDFGFEVNGAYELQSRRTVKNSVREYRGNTDWILALLPVAQSKDNVMYRWELHHGTKMYESADFEWRQSSFFEVEPKDPSIRLRWNCVNGEPPVGTIMPERIASAPGSRKRETIPRFKRKPRQKSTKPHGPGFEAFDTCKPSTGSRVNDAGEEEKAEPIRSSFQSPQPQSSLPEMKIPSASSGSPAVSSSISDPHSKSNSKSMDMEEIKAGILRRMSPTSDLYSTGTMSRKWSVRSLEPSSVQSDDLQSDDLLDPIMEALIQDNKTPKEKKEIWREYQSKLEKQIMSMEVRWNE